MAPIPAYQRKKREEKERKRRGEKKYKALPSQFRSRQTREPRSMNVDGIHIRVIQAKMRKEKDNKDDREKKNYGGKK
jgi:hypothetical protein